MESKTQTHKHTHTDVCDCCGEELKFYEDYVLACCENCATVWSRVVIVEFHDHNGISWYNLYQQSCLERTIEEIIKTEEYYIFRSDTPIWCISKYGSQTYRVGLSTPNTKYVGCRRDGGYYPIITISDDIVQERFLHDHCEEVKGITSSVWYKEVPEEEEE